MAKVKELTLTYWKHSDSGKTVLWRVVGTGGPRDILGQIRWHGAWRKYIFVTRDVEILLAPNCLRAIADFCERETKRQLSKTPLQNWRDEECIRVSGDIECELCGTPYRQHVPVSPDIAPSLRRACDGTLLKL